jgi:hypothetical protein
MKKEILKLIKEAEKKRYSNNNWIRCALGGAL